MNDFILDIEALRENARSSMMDGPVTSTYGLDKTKVVDVLNQLLATEIVCSLRYRSHYHRATGLRAEAAAAEFLEHAQQEEEHAHRLAERITQLQGEPNLDPNGLSSRAHSEYKDKPTLRGMIEENLIAERVAVSTYTSVIRWLADHDPTTRRMIEDILAVEEEHADDMAGLLETE